MDKDFKNANIQKNNEIQSGTIFLLGLWIAFWRMNEIWKTICEQKSDILPHLKRLLQLGIAGNLVRAAHAAAE